MIERVALAISGGDDPASILSIHRTRARAAIEAMREPTQAMMWAMDWNVERGRTKWRAAIDEALK